MKKILVIILFLGLISCSNTDDPNTILPNFPVSEEVNLSNPSNNALLAVGGWVEILGGIKGIVVYHASIDNYLAYDLACPHLQPSACTKMIIEDGLTMKCTCDDSKFALALGGAPQSGTQFPARQYRVIKGGNSLFITNF
jgi:nitrite reductase/ring-hydroxylating ferredoxin subunit